MVVTLSFIDTVSMSRQVNPELKNHKLDTLANYFELGDFDHHRAFEDAHMLALIFNAMGENYNNIIGFAEIGYYHDKGKYKVIITKN